MNTAAVLEEQHHILQEACRYHSHIFSLLGVSKYFLLKFISFFFKVQGNTYILLAYLQRLKAKCTIKGSLLDVYSEVEREESLTN